MATNTERIVKLEAEIAGKERVGRLEQQIEDLKQNVCEVKNTITVGQSELKDIIKEFIESADKKYVNKESYDKEFTNTRESLKVMWTLIVTVLTLVVGYMIYINQAFLQHIGK